MNGICLTMWEVRKRERERERERARVRGRLGERRREGEADRERGQIALTFAMRKRVVVARASSSCMKKQGPTLADEAQRLLLSCGTVIGWSDRSLWFG